MDPKPALTLLLNDPRPAQDRVHDLLPLIYDQLRAAARSQLASERHNHTLSATALVHEAYLKLCGPRDLPWQNRAHFYTASAQAMRQVLLDHARAKSAEKRGGSARQAALDLTCLPDLSSPDQSAGFLLLDQAITRLETEDPAAAAIVRLRFFTGLSIPETALALGVSEPTVKRHWAFARGWLKQAIESAADEPSPG